MMKRFIVFLMALVMLVSAVPAFAVETVNIEDVADLASMKGGMSRLHGCLDRIWLSDGMETDVKRMKNLSSTYSLKDKKTGVGVDIYLIWGYGSDADELLKSLKREGINAEKMILNGNEVLFADEMGNKKNPDYQVFTHHYGEYWTQFIVYGNKKQKDLMHTIACSVKALDPEETLTVTEEDGIKVVDLDFIDLRVKVPADCGVRATEVFNSGSLNMKYEITGEYELSIGEVPIGRFSGSDFEGIAKELEKEQMDGMSTETEIIALSDGTEALYAVQTVDLDALKAALSSLMGSEGEEAEEDEEELGIMRAGMVYVSRGDGIWTEIFAEPGLEEVLRTFCETSLEVIPGE